MYSTQKGVEIPKIGGICENFQSKCAPDETSNGIPNRLLVYQKKYETNICSHRYPSMKSYLGVPFQHSSRQGLSSGRNARGKMFLKPVKEASKYILAFPEAVYLLNFQSYRLMKFDPLMASSPVTKMSNFSQESQKAHLCVPPGEKSF